MDCAQVERRLWEYLDGALSPEEAVAVAAHLTICGRCDPECRCCRAFLAMVTRVLQSQPGAPEILRTRLRFRLTSES
jgi:anti-sigma factor RsiW